MNSYINNSGDEDSSVLCLNGQQWPPLKYYTDLNNLGKDQEDIIPITEMCGRCNNGYRFSDGRICVNCSDNRNNFNQWVQDEDGKYERPPGLSVDIGIGKNPLCTVGVISDAEPLTDTCENLKNNRSLTCNNAVFKSSGTSTAENFYTNCCTYCNNNQYFVAPTGEGNGSCEECQEGRVQDTNDSSNQNCTLCPDNTYRSASMDRCESCPEGEIPIIDKSECEVPTTFIRSQSFYYWTETQRLECDRDAGILSTYDCQSTCTGSADHPRSAECRYCCTPER